MKKKSLLLLILLIIAFILPHVFYPVFIAKLFCYTLFALSFYLLYAYTGLLSFGHALFWGIGAYSYALISNHHEFPLEAALLISTTISSLLGIAIAFLATKRSGIYFSMVTMAISQLFYFLALKWPQTGGEDGLQVLNRKSLFINFSGDEQFQVYYVSLIIFLPAALALYRICHSPFGFALKAIKSHETKARTLGYNPERLKIICFSLSAIFAGLAGALKVFVTQIASLEDLHWHLSGDAVLMTLLGGSSLFWGPALGALVVLLLQNYLTGIGAWLIVVQGSLFISCVMFFKDGLAGLFNKK